jgi:hypothetical protein
MHPLLLAFILVIAMLVVGFVVYGLIFKNALAGTTPALNAGRVIGAAIAMYITALTFIALYNDITFASGSIGINKGFYLGLILGIPIFALPLFTDHDYFATKNEAVWAVMINWIFSFAVMGILVGLLA